MEKKAAHNLVSGLIGLAIIREFYLTHIDHPFIDLMAPWRDCLSKDEVVVIIVKDQSDIIYWNIDDINEQ